MRLLTSRAILFLLTSMLLAGCSTLNTLKPPTASASGHQQVAAQPVLPPVDPLVPEPGMPRAPGSLGPSLPGSPVAGGTEPDSSIAPETGKPSVPAPPVKAPPSPAPHPTPLPPPAGKPATDLESLRSDLAAYLAYQSGTWGVYVLDLESGKGVGLNADEPFLTASTFKLPMALYILRQVEQGKASLDELLTYREARDYEEGTGTLQNSIEDGDRLPIRRLLELAITQSDNIATNILLNRFGTVNIHAFMQEMGGTVTRYDELRNGTTPREMARYMQLAAGRTVITNPTLRQMLMTWLSSTVFTDRIVAGVPEGVRVAHKIGTLDGVVNDVGLVYGPKRSFVLAVYSLDVNDEDEAADVIAEVAARVYQCEQALTAP